MQARIIHEGLFRPEQEKTHVHLPLDVPTGAVRLDVSYSYSDQISSDPLISGGNTIDLGVFDARGIDFLSAGFRGWSGSQRHSFFITEDEATPGYLPGALIAGRWHVSLGLYKVAPGGCSFRVEAKVTSEPDHRPQKPLPTPAASLPASAPLAKHAPWLCGELHCHTWHSDGQVSPADLVALARARGLDFLAISDHNTTAAHRELADLADPGLILIPAIEVTTYKGHFNVWGSADWIDYRIETPTDMSAALAKARAGGGLTSCCHPKPFGPAWDFAEVDSYDCIEVWNGPWFSLNPVSLDFWLERIRHGRRLPALAGSDWHRLAEMQDDTPRAPGRPVTWVRVDGKPSAQAILTSIRSGRVTLSHDVGGPLLEMTAGAHKQALTGDRVSRPASGVLPIQIRCQRGAGYILLIMDQDHTLHEQKLTQDDEAIAVGIAVGGAAYVRAELRDSEETMMAMTNPIYLC
jgi:hypothetical protein